MHCSLFTFTLALNSILFWKLLVFEFLLGISENFPCSLSAVLANIVLLDALHLPMLFVETLTYLKTKLFLLIIFYIVICIYVHGTYIRKTDGIPKTYLLGEGGGGSKLKSIKISRSILFTITILSCIYYLYEEVKRTRKEYQGKEGRR
jgi:hypothetical protein